MASTFFFFFFAGGGGGGEESVSNRAGETTQDFLSAGQVRYH